MVADHEILEQQLAGVRDVQARIDLMNDYAWDNRNVDVARALEISQAAYELASAHHYTRGLAYSLRNLSRFHNVNGNYELAFLNGLESKALFEALDDRAGLAQSVNVLSQILWELGNHSDALEYTLQFLDLARQIGNRAFEADALNNSAMVYARLRQYDNALEMVQRALPLFQAADDKRGQIFALNNIAMLHFLRGDFAGGLPYGHESYRIAHEVGFVVPKVVVLDTLGQIESALGHYAAALAHLQQALEIAQAQDLKRDELYALLNIGRILSEQGDADDALQHLQRALQLAEELATKQSLFECHEALATLYERRGDFERALHHYREFHRYNREVFNAESDKKLKGLEVRQRTEAARKEAEIYQLKNQELEREIARRQEVERDLVAAKEAAEIANQAKSEFLSNMSHELRTPLNGILGYAQILRRDPALTARQLEGVEIIYRSGEHLLTLINDVLDLSKIEARKLELHPTEVHLPTLLENVVGLMHMRARQKQLEFIYEPVNALPIGVVVDEKRLRQVLINLLGNAIKFTHAGHIALRVTNLSAEETAQALLRFEVLDTGVGMRTEDLEKIFLPFEQVGDNHSRSEGTGLGLSISQSLAEAMGSRLCVQSTLGQGSRFWFDVTLPITMMPLYRSLQGDAQTIVGYDGRRRRILVVDDEAQNRALLVNLLQPLGFELDEAADGRACLERAAAAPPDAVLMDLVMPVMTGFEAARRLRDGASSNRPVVIAVSASVLGIDPQEYLDVGCDEFLAKPIDLENLLHHLGRHLGLRWRYSDAAAAASAAQQTADLIVPSPVELEQLGEFAQMGDMIGLVQYAADLMAAEPHWEPFLRQLQELAASFEDEQVIDLLRRHLPAARATADLASAVRVYT